MKDVFYKLINNIPTPCDVYEYGEWRKTNDKHIFHDELNGMFVSTVFLGLNLGMFRGTDLFFETMIFRGSREGIVEWSGLYEDRYETYEQAAVGHKKALRWAKCIALV